MSVAFPHQNLDSYELALQLAEQAKEISDRIPRGHRGLAEQLMRSGPAVALLIAEGANRWSRGHKRLRFAEARGECAEAAATVEVLARIGLVPVADAERFGVLANRIAATLTGLIRRFS